jgi:hypothetical protein
MVIGNYNYPVSLLMNSINVRESNFYEIVFEVRDWIDREHINAIESNFEYTWYFMYDSDRTILLLKWSD